MANQTSKYIKGVYRIDAYGGRMSLIRAASLASAVKIARASEGYTNVARVEKASAEDVAWFEAMGGRI